jgi:predicted N-formylglutamate amidohydrolase
VQLIVTCEHAGNHVPAAYAERFARTHDLLDSHRAYDIGAKSVARRLARTHGGVLHVSKVTRLIVDLNRSPGHRRLFSWMTADMTAEGRARTIARYYTPYRSAVEADIERMLRRRGRVLHVSVHSFTSSLDGEVRNADLGLLYDPSRAHEKRMALRWRDLVRAADPSIRVRRNYPYTGVQDGFQPWLRRRFPTPRYTAIEIEMNQAVLADPVARRGFVRVVDASVGALLAR